MKHILRTLLLVTVLTLTLTATALAADDSGSCGDNVTYSYSNGTLTISGTGEMEDYFITMPWFSYREDITTVIISDGVTAIGEYAFYSCSNLTSVTIADSVTSIETWAFYSCASLTSIDIPNSVTFLGEQSFGYCESLESITIPSSVTSFGITARGGAYTFTSCKNLTSVTFLSPVTTIDAGMFSACLSLTSIYIPSWVTEIGSGAFTYVGQSVVTEVYYGGSQLQWNAIENKDCLDTFTIHYNSAMPTTSTTTTTTTIPEVTPTTTEVATSTLPYNGDLSAMNMSAEQAVAFAEIAVDYEYVALFDAGDGVPGLWGATSYYDEDMSYEAIGSSHIWLWDGQQATCHGMGTQTKIFYNDNEILWGQILSPKQAVDTGWARYFTFENGQISDNVPYEHIAFLVEGSGTTATDFVSYIEQYMEYSSIGALYYPVDWSTISSQDIVSEYYCSYVYITNGQVVSKQATGISQELLPSNDTYQELWPAFWEGESNGIQLNLTGTWGDAAATAELLRNYASTYTAPTPTPTPTYADVTFDFGKLNTTTSADDFIAYLESLLTSVDDEISDTSKSELATFIENAIATESTTAVTATNNVVLLTGDTISDSIDTASEAYSAYKSLLNAEDITLNKGISLIIRIIGNQMDVGQAMEVMLDASLLDVIDNETLEIYLGSTTHAIQITAENLETLIDVYGTVSVQIQSNEDGTYTLNFLDEDREIIDTLEAPVTVTLPCDNEFYTVMARYGTEIDNWGGQYSDLDGTISFSTPYTGVYELLDNSQTIADIDSLPTETQNAIQFMISKGFFILDDEDNFNPDNSLSRQDATQALVSMFFTLDRTLTCDFSDVSADSFYYSYIASAAADSIVEGYGDGTFGGENAMTTEQLLTIIARTLVEKKGYTYPENPAEYLTISGSENTGEWAQETVALAIREGIVLDGETIDPTTPVTREDAALYLYRLFMLLEEVRPVAIEMDIEAANLEEVAVEEEGLSQGAIMAVAGLVIVAVPAAVFVPKLIKKRKV